MFKRFFKNRFTWVGICCVLIFSLLGAQLYRLQLQMGSAYDTTFQEGKSKEIRLTGTRGMILDHNGVPLAYDQKSYNVTFVKDPSKKKDSDLKAYTSVIRETIQIIEKNGGKCSSNFGIRQQEDGSFAFYWGDISAEAAASREKRWRSYMSIKDTLTAEQAYWNLRERYGIEDDVSYEEAFKILSIWQDVQETAYRSYMPVTVANNVDMTTVAEIEMRSMDLTGMEIAESTTRIYPKQELAAHVVGYMGRMMDETTIRDMQDAGYVQTDLIGISGVESTMESQLSGNTSARTGKKVVEVNSLGKAIRELEDEYVSPSSGNNVVLTLDADLQAVVEQALSDNISSVNATQQTIYAQDKATYDGLVADRGGSELQLASSGAAIVMDVQNGDVLAMASNPSYNLNMFTGGLSQEDYATLRDDTRTPLLNKAIGSRGTPGSIFKMTTGLAGLMEGVLTPSTRISDEGEFRKHINDPNAKGPSCWIKSGYAAHANQTLSDALKNSCNYFFFDVSYAMGIDKLYGWAADLGLDSKTNVQLTGEVASQMASQNALYNPDTPPNGISALVYNNIYRMLQEACEAEGLSYDDERYDAVTLELMNMAVDSDTQEYGSDARALMRSELKLPMSRITGGLFSEISMQLNQIIWNSNQTIVAGIGQSVSMMTPIGIARYLSALVNGGNVYDANIIDYIVSPNGTVVEDQAPRLVRNLEVPQEYLDVIKEGMANVVSPEEGGTAASYFEGFKYLGQFGGKTGTAQVSRIDLEDNSWFVAFAPFDKPEIAIVIYIPHGYKGGLSSTAAKTIIEYYMDNREAAGEVPQIPGDNTLVP